MPEKKPTRTADLDYFYGQSSELFSFYRIPKLLFQDSRFQPLSTDAKILYGILLDRMSFSARNGWLDKAGRVFIIYTVQEVQDSLGCADKKATKLLRELEEYGLIERKRRGLGKPDLIYVKNFSSESSKTPYMNRDNDDSCGFKIACQDPAKSRCNKTKENDTEMSETDPFYSEEADGMSKRTQLEEYFSQSLEVELLLRLCPDDEDTIYQIMDLLVDTCATKRKTLRIAGDDKPAEVVRSRFKKLNADHIRFVLKCLAENSSPIRNMKQYLLASLYNAPTTMQLFYQNQTNPRLSDAEVIKISKKATTIAIVNQKGGTGKTTTCENLGIGLAMEGKKVLLVDADPQGSLTISMGWQQPDELPTTLSTLMQKAMNDQSIPPGEGVLHHAEGVDLIPANIELAGLEVALANSMNREKMLKQVLDGAKREYDFILLDCTPSLGMLTVNALAAADTTLIPVQAQYLSAKGLEQLLQTVQKVRRQINPKLKIEGILLTMTDSRTNYGQQIDNLIRGAYGSKIKVFDQTIPRSVRAAEISAVGKSIFQHDPKGKVAEAYKSLTEEVMANAERQLKRVAERGR